MIWGFGAYGFITVAVGLFWGWALEGLRNVGFRVRGNFGLRVNGNLWFSVLDIGLMSGASSTLTFTAFVVLGLNCTDWGLRDLGP